MNKILNNFFRGAFALLLFSTAGYAMDLDGKEEKKAVHSAAKPSITKGSFEHLFVEIGESKGSLSLDCMLVSDDIHSIYRTLSWKPLKSEMSYNEFSDDLFAQVCAHLKKKSLKHYKDIDKTHHIAAIFIGDLKGKLTPEKHEDFPQLTQKIDIFTKFSAVPKFFAVVRRK